MRAERERAKMTRREKSDKKRAWQVKWQREKRENKTSRCVPTRVQMLPADECNNFKPKSEMLFDSSLFSAASIFLSACFSTSCLSLSLSLSLFFSLPLLFFFSSCPCRILHTTKQALKYNLFALKGRERTAREKV